MISLNKIIHCLLYKNNDEDRGSTKKLMKGGDILSPLAKKRNLALKLRCTPFHCVISSTIKSKFK